MERGQNAVADLHSDRPKAEAISVCDRPNKSETYGFNAQTEEYVDMLKAGIVDPAKVVRIALQDAASIAGLLITTEAMIAEAPKKDAPAMPGAGMGGMGGLDY